MACLSAAASLQGAALAAAPRRTRNGRAARLVVHAGLFDKVGGKMAANSIDLDKRLGRWFFLPKDMFCKPP
jgi:hypothetical protein